MNCYVADRAPRAEVLRLRGLNFQLYHWPGNEPDPIVLLHGWGDSAETWQFLVDCVPQRRTLVGCDARGFGRSEWPQDGYWFPDYLADLEALIDQLSPQRPVDIVGHSMGANVAMLYAGIRPQRVRRLIALEGLGLARSTAGLAPAHYRQWLDELRDGVQFATYDDYPQFEEVLSRRNPRTPAAHIKFIARAWAVQRADGRIELRADPRHKRSNAVLYQRDQAEACWKCITAPVLFAVGDQSEFVRRMQAEVAPEKLHSLTDNLRTATVKGAGHMMHHEQPAAVAELIEDFLR